MSKSKKSMSTLDIFRAIKDFDLDNEGDLREGEAVVVAAGFPVEGGAGASAINIKGSAEDVLCIVVNIIKMVASDSGASFREVLADVRALEKDIQMMQEIDLN